jgi:hypothetical protein
MSGPTDRAIRDLAALERTGSTSRVLNLIAVEREYGSTPEYAAEPFFEDRTLNRAIILKHRLRSNEMSIFHDGRQTATKLIIPFTGDELRLGGRSMFIGQPGWLDLLVGACAGPSRLHRDILLLETLDELPSMDPFLLRERTRLQGFNIAQCYFALSAADRTKMRAFCAEQIRQLINMAYGEVGPANESYSEKLANALLSSQIDERLEPLRQTLRLQGEAYREGVFGWRGFLYYKWVLATLQPTLAGIVQEMDELVVSGSLDRPMLKYLDQARRRLRKHIAAELGRVASTIGVYDKAFAAMTVKADPQPFVHFLRHAPGMFTGLGERIGAVSHVASFWRYRFPAGKPLRAPIEEAVGIFKDFEDGLALDKAA